MTGGARFSIIGAIVLLALAGCGRGFFQDAERAPWRREAEVACLKSGAVKLGTGAEQIEPIDGPGVCGADFPLKVTALGELPLLSFADQPRPPARIPGASSADLPRWPVRPVNHVRPPQPIDVAPPRTAPVDGTNMRWVTGPPGIERPEAVAPAGQPMSITPEVAPAMAVPADEPRTVARPRPWVRPDDIPDDAVIPPGGSAAVPAPPMRPAYDPPAEPPRLGPARGPYSPAAIPQATMQPAAKLACPMVSALDLWVREGVQPAAMHWFNSPVAVIHQIGSYACRSMNGAGGHGISEHAFGNALDVAGFTLANGRKVTIKDGWHGTPEEQGFLRDVHLYACETFITVLGPGYNAAHYNHFHVDLMRRPNGRRPCRPTAVRGEIVAAKVRARQYAEKQRAPRYTGSLAAGVKAAKADLLEAVAGEDGYVVGEDNDVTGSIDAADAPRSRGRARPATRLDVGRAAAY